MRRPSLPKLRRRGGPPGAKPSSAAGAKPRRKLPALKLPGSSNRPPLKLILPAAAAIVVVVALLATCGTSDEQNVRDTVNRFGQASREKDYQALCDDLLSAALVERLRTADQPCEVVLRIGLRDVRDPTLEVRSIHVAGDQATAAVDSAAAGQPPLKTRILLVRENGDWRISSLPDEKGPGAGP